MKKFLLFLLTLAILIPVISYSQIQEDPLPNVSTIPCEEIGINYAQVGGMAYGNEITSRGNCYSTNPNPSIEDQIVIMESAGEGGWHTYIYNLEQYTTYYIRAFATNSAGTSYGEEYIITTTDVERATTTTIEVNNISGNKATVLCSANGVAIIERGICLNANPYEEPDITYTVIKDASIGEGPWSIQLDDLVPNQTYYVKAYAKNEAGYGYGNVISFTTGSLVSPNYQDSLALVAFYNSTGGPDWTVQTGWLEPGVPIPEWYGIQTNSEGFVTGIGFDSPNNLDGTLPPEIGQLTHLNSINLPNENLYGNLPEELGLLTELRTLDLNNCHLTGTPPVSVFQLPELTTLWLTENDFDSWELPIEFYNQTSLISVRIESCNITGELNSLIGNLNQLVTLEIRGNDLSGTIPEEISGLTSIEELRLGNNNFTGAIPQGVYSLTSLLDLDLAYTSLDGTFSELIGNLVNLRYLGLEGSGMTGVLPSSLCGLPNFERIDLAFNNFDDQSCPVIQCLINNDVYILGSEQHGGFDLINDCNILSLTDRQKDSLALVALYNATDGPNWNNNENWLSERPIEEWYGVTAENDRVIRLDLRQNNLRGTLPTNFYNLNELSYLALWENEDLGGELNSNICAMINLQYIHLWNTGIGGFIAPEINNLYSLKELNVNSTQIGGTIPYEIGSCLELSTLSIENCSFEGVLPESICDLPLTEVNFGYNFFNSESCPVLQCIIDNGGQFVEDQIQKNGFDPIAECDLREINYSMQDSLALVTLYNATDGPNWINNDGWLDPEVPVSEWYGVRVENGHVTALFLGNNNLNGMLPVEFYELSKLSILFMPNNQLHGSILPEIAKLQSLERLVLYNNQLEGSIPNELGQLSNLIVLRLSNNQLSGIVPSPFGQLSNLWLLLLNDNNLSGSLPVELCQLPLARVNFAMNNFDDQSCETVQCLVENDVTFLGDPLQIQNDGISLINGCFPISESDSLALVAIFGETGGENWNNNENWLEGPLESWHGVTIEKGRVVGLNLFENNLLGTLPPAFFELTELEEVSFGWNSMLTLEWTNGLESLENLRLLDVNGTNIFGGFPESLLSCISLSELRMSHCGLDYIPEEICELPLIEVDFQQNNLNSNSCPAFNCMYENGVFFGGDDAQKQADGHSIIYDCDIPILACSVTDSMALINFYNKTNGDNWNNNGYWKTDIPVAMWHGVTIRNGRVAELWLQGNNLNGDLPEDFYDLSELFTVVITDNPLLTGSISSSIENLQIMHHLNLSATGIGGIIPEELGNCSGLLELHLNHTNLLGAIPLNLCNAPLTHIDIAQNYFDISSCPAMECIINKGVEVLGDPYQTQKDGLALTIECGTYPYSVPESDSLALVDLYNSTGGENWYRQENWLNGPVYTWYGVTVENHRVTQINLGWNNNLIGELPASIVELDALEVIILYGNQISGQLPENIHLMQSLRILQLSANQFRGELPTNFWNLPNIEEIHIWANQLSGELPEEVGNLEKLRILSIGGNLFSGLLPSTLQNITGLEQLHLDHNYFSGAIPVEICSLPLTQARFDYNNFDNSSCPTIECLLENGLNLDPGGEWGPEPGQIQWNGFSLINGCACTTPVVDYISATTDPVQLGIEIEISFFSSSGYIESAHWNWGDGTTTDVDVEGEITTSHLYTEPGVYTPILTLVGCNEVVDTIYRYIVIYNPEGGFVTGAGWIESPLGASTLYPEASGIAHFGFVSKYQQGATLPEGRTQFKFTAGDLNYRSDEYEWLVVAGSKAKFKGVGTINGIGEYGFMISAIDGDVKEKGDPDMFRIKIWDTIDESVVYDNQMGAEIDEDPLTAIGAGSIVVHNPNTKSALIDESESSNKIHELKLYPNPTTGEVYIESGELLTQNIEVLVFSIDGAKVFQKTYQPSDRIRFSLSNYVSGIYLVKIKTENQRVVQKLVLDKN